jgi:hypothetical protein
MNLRLTVAEKLNSAQDLDGFYRELGLFRGLLDYTLVFLATHSRNDKKTLDNYKRLEISLRGFIPRLETIHRDIPLQYEDYVRELLKYLRQARTKAVEPLFSDTVIPGRKQE